MYVSFCHNFLTLLSNQYLLLTHFPKILILAHFAVLISVRKDYVILNCMNFSWIFLCQERFGVDGRGGIGGAPTGVDHSKIGQAKETQLTRRPILGRDTKSTVPLWQGFVPSFHLRLLLFEIILLYIRKTTRCPFSLWTGRSWNFADNNGQRFVWQFCAKLNGLLTNRRKNGRRIRNDNVSVCRRIVCVILNWYTPFRLVFGKIPSVAFTGAAQGYGFHEETSGCLFKIQNNNNYCLEARVTNREHLA